MRSRHRRACSHRGGFTLIELLIALAIMALLSILGYRAIAAVAGSEAALSAESARWRTLDAFFARMEADLRKALPRPVRVGDRSDDALVGSVDAAGNAELRMSRAGAEFTLEPGAAGQRIGYRFVGNRIEIRYWPWLDVPSGVEPATYTLVEDVAMLRLGYLDSGSAWRDRWPVPSEADLPRAVRVELTLANGEVIERWLALR